MDYIARTVQASKKPRRCRKTIPVARRVLGEGDAITLKMTRMSRGRSTRTPVPRSTSYARL